MSNTDYGELVWENGQIVMKGGQSSKVSNKDSFINSKTGISRIGLSLDGGDDYDVVAPWIRYQSGDPVPHESASGFLAEVSGVTSNEIPSHASFGDQLSEMRLQKKQGKEVQHSSGAVNFANFVRPIAKAKANLANVGARASDRFLNHGTEEAKMMIENNRAVEGQANDVCGRDGLKLNQSIGGDSKAKRMDAEKCVEGAFCAPSACSGNSDERAKNYLTHHFKRNHSLLEDGEDSSEDAEEESVSIKKTQPKRNRTAEGHSLSERKRREKINEKMRALQDLVPYCNKVDKAAMLDEAIDYLRTLQLQVQMMSMRAQICTPLMIPQAALQPLQTVAHLPPFAPMGVGMGLVYQTGVPDMSRGFPVQGMPFPGPSHPPPQLWMQPQGFTQSAPDASSVPDPAANSMTTEISNLKNPNIAD